MVRCVRVSEVERATPPPAAVSPDEVHLPGIYVHRLILGKDYEKRIEKRTTSAGTDAAASIAGAAHRPHASHGAQLRAWHALFAQANSLPSGCASSSARR